MDTIHQTMNDMVSVLEDREIVVALTADTISRKVVIDLDFLKTCHRLKDAVVFNRLFNLRQFKDFNCKLKKSNRGELLILKHLYVNKEDWILLMQFLRTGLVRGYANYMNTGDNRSNVLYSLEKLMDMSNIFGGIPSIDKFYNDFFCEKDKKLEKLYYNPLLPEDDYLKIYKWIAIRDTGSTSQGIFFNGRSDKALDWSFTTINSKGGSNFYMYRKYDNSEVIFDNILLNNENRRNTHIYFSSSDDGVTTEEGTTETESDEFEF